jgi:hypothetical protein
MKIVTLVLTGLLGSAINFVGESSNQSILPDGVYVQSFEFRPLFRTGAEEAEWNPTNPFDPKPREGTIGSTPMPGRDPSTEALMRELPQERHGFEVYLQLKNSGSRTIKKLDWDFLFLDSESGSELKRFSISSKTKIRSGEVKFLTKQVLPGLFLKGRTKPDYAKGKSAVVIRSIEFADGSKWERDLGKP